MARGLLRSTAPRRQPFVLLCIVSPLVLCLGWTALWLFAQREAAITMDGWVAREAERGRAWACPDREIAGFPFELRLTCAAPTYRGLVERETADVTVAALTATVSLFQPKAVEVSFTSPFTLARPDRDHPETLSWSSMIMRARLLPDGRARLEVQTSDPSLDSGGQIDAAAHVEVHVAPAQGRSLEDHAYDVWFTLEQGRFPALNALTGEEAPISLDEKGVLTAVDPTAMAPWPVLVEAWRQAGGTLDIATFKAEKGDFRAEARGRLGLDEAHRPTGRLDTSVSGYETLASRFGISPRALSVGTLLSRLLAKNEPSASTGPPAVKLPLTFADGRVSIGPVVTPQRLAPLY